MTAHYLGAGMVAGARRWLFSRWRIGRRQLILAVELARRHDDRLGAVVAAWSVAVGVVVGALLAVLVQPVLAVVAVPAAVGAAVVVLGRRAQSAAYDELEGSQGAAGAVLTTLGRGWTVRQVVAVSPVQDVVHRAVGRAGVVLVGEGDPARVRALLAVERRRHAAVVGDVAVYAVTVGDRDEDVPLRMLVRHVRGLPRRLGRAEAAEVVQRLAVRLPVPDPRRRRGGSR